MSIVRNELHIAPKITPNIRSVMSIVEGKLHSAAKTEAEWILVHPPSLSDLLFFRYLNR